MPTKRKPASRKTAPKPHRRNEVRRGAAAATNGRLASDPRRPGAALTDAEERIAVPGNRAIDAITPFLRVFESPGFSFGTVVTEPGHFPFAVHAAQVNDFVQALYGQGWVVDFDWGRWQTEAETYFREPARLATAEIATLQKLLTLHVRKDRFCEGHLLEMFEAGHITAILRQLKSIRGT